MSGNKQYILILFTCCWSFTDSRKMSLPNPTMYLFVITSFDAFLLGSAMFGSPCPKAYNKIAKSMSTVEQLWTALENGV